MNLSQLNRGTRTSNLLITKPTILHMVPDFNKSLYQMLFSSGINLMNCFLVVTKSRPLKLGGKLFNARKLYLTAKKELTTPADKHRAIKVMQNVPKNIPKGKFIVIDHSITSQATKYISELTNTKRGLYFLFQQLKKEFKFIKAKFPDYENNILFLFNNQNNKEELSIYDLLKRFIVLSEDELNNNFRTFDKFILSSINVNSSSTILPISGINKRGNIEIYKNNLTQIVDLMNKSEETISDLKNLKMVKSDNNKTELTKDISNVEIEKKLEVKDNNIRDTIEINRPQLTRILKKYKIKDKTIGDNIKAAIDNYIKTTSKISDEDLEESILKAINLTVFGTTEINDDYRNDPKRLISKLEEVNTYSKDIKIPTTKIDNIVSPKEVIGLEKVTGLVRQEYEFSDNIHKHIKTLFKALENRNSFPIKIVGFKYDYEDNNLNRVINYHIKLKNQVDGSKEPYDVNIKVPAIINDRYFKLNGKQYIISNQQFMVPITKTENNECRLLTSYATLTLSIVNMQFNLSQTEDIIEYIEQRYSNIIKEIEKENGKILNVKFKNGVNIDLYRSPYYSSSSEKLILEENKLLVEKNNETREITIGKAEFLFDKLVEQIQSVNPEEEFRKSKKSIPYIQLFVQGVKIPLIVYLWQQIGLLNALTKLGINYEVKNQDKLNDIEFTERTIVIPLKNDDNLIIYNESKRQELISNGLLYINMKKFKFDKKEINDKHSIEQYIQSNNGTRSTYNLDLNTENLIDPVTKEILEFQDKPITLVNLLTEEMIPKLLNDKANELTDLTIYRSRQAEIMFHLMYKQLMQAHNNYKSSIGLGDDEAKLFLKENYIIECLLGVHPHSKGNSTLELVNTQNPIGELKSAAKLIKTGPGGIPGRRSFKKQHRGIHPTYYGNIGANATSESNTVGIVNHL